MDDRRLDGLGSLGSTGIGRGGHEHFACAFSEGVGLRPVVHTAVHLVASVDYS